MSRIRHELARALTAAGKRMALYTYTDYSADEVSLYQRVRGQTMTSMENVVTLRRALEHLAAAKVDGAVVECGVWRGGSMMAAALTLAEIGDFREMYLYDTFTGMSVPTDADRTIRGTSAAAKAAEVGGAWQAADMRTVHDNITGTGYPMDRVHLVPGKVEDTIPGTLPDRIALLRLDTDFYESTRHELEHLYPLLARGGVCIIDDYGHWQGARQAVDEFFADSPVFLHRIDYSARSLVKP